MPYAFDGAGTVTVGDSATTLVFRRSYARSRSSSRRSRTSWNCGGSVLISTIADVTFFGKDQTGNDVAVTGSISVNFADWGDPEA